MGYITGTVVLGSIWQTTWRGQCCLCLHLFLGFALGNHFPTRSCMNELGPLFVTNGLQREATMKVQSALGAGGSRLSEVHVNILHFPGFLLPKQRQTAERKGESRPCQSGSSGQPATSNLVLRKLSGTKHCDLQNAIVCDLVAVAFAS